MADIPENKKRTDISDDILERFAAEGKKAEAVSRTPINGERTAAVRKATASAAPAIRSASADSAGKQPSKRPGRQAVTVADEQAMEKRRKVAFWILIGITVAILLFFIVFVAFFKDNHKKPLFKDNYFGVHAFDPSNAFSDLTYNLPEGFTYPDGIQEKYKPLYAAHQNFVGWLTVPNTSIDTAVYQAHDNDYYLKKDLWGGYSRYGTVFMDYCDNITNMRRNTVIYGHNFDDDGDASYDDIIFGDIHKYLNVDFYRTAPVIEFNTLYRDYKWKVIGCFYSNGTSAGDNDYLFYYIATGMNDQNFADFINEVNQRSYIHTAVDIQPSDKLLTLSTCTYFFDKNGKKQNARCVLVARMVRDGESEEVDVMSAVQNTNPRYPQLYYDVFGGENPYKDGSKWYPAE